MYFKRKFDMASRRVTNTLLKRFEPKVKIFSFEKPIELEQFKHIIKRVWGLDPTRRSPFRSGDMFHHNH